MIHFKLSPADFLLALENSANLMQATPFYDKVKFSVETLKELR